MSLLELLNPESSPEHAELYESSRYDDESPFQQVMLHNPAVLRAKTEFEKAVLESGAVDATLYEYIMVVVAQTNDCAYCAGSHRLKLQSIGGVSEAVIAALADGAYETLPDRERAVVEFTEQVVAAPHRVTDAHLESLYAVGFEESDVIQLLGAIANCNASNMIVSSLGITPDHRSDDLPTY